MSIVHNVTLSLILKILTITNVKKQLSQISLSLSLTLTGHHGRYHTRLSAGYPE